MGHLVSSQKLRTFLQEKKLVCWEVVPTLYQVEIYIFRFFLNIFPLLSAFNASSPATLSMLETSWFLSPPLSIPTWPVSYSSPCSTLNADIVVILTGLFIIVTSLTECSAMNAPFCNILWPVVHSKVFPWSAWTWHVEGALEDPYLKSFCISMHWTCQAQELCYTKTKRTLLHFRWKCSSSMWQGLVETMHPGGDSQGEVCEIITMPK